MRGRTLLVLALVTLAAAAPRSRRQNQLEPFTLEESVPSQYGQTGFNGNWFSSTEFTYTVPGVSGINIFDMETRESRTLVGADLLEQLGTNNPIFSPDRLYILAPSEVQSVYRYSTTARYALYNLASGEITNIHNHERLQLCIFDGVTHSVAYVFENDVWYLPADSGTPIRITFDGQPGVIYNGHTDWVYEEDMFYTGQALWFSTDGSRLAVASFDDTAVDSYSYYYFADNRIDPDDVYPELFDLKYPKVGHPNPIVTLRWLTISELIANPTVVNWQTITAPAEVTNDHVLGGVRWVTANEIAVHWLNRRQNYSILNICNVITNACVPDIRSQPNGWVPAVLPTFGSNGDFYVSLRWSPVQADQSVWQHLYVTMRIGSELSHQSVSPGLFTVDTFIGFDEANALYYYTRTNPGQPWNRHVYVSGTRAACLSCNIQMPQGGGCTWASGTLSPGGRFMSITCASTYEPSYTVLIEPWTTTPQYVWQDNQGVRDRLANKMNPRTIITTVPLEDGQAAPVRLYLPPDLDEEDTETTYPMIIYVYSGPNTFTVSESFAVGYHSYLTTNRSIIYMMADGRGSGLKGQEMLYTLNNRLGSVEIEDHLVILRQVLDRYPYIDRTRIGMWGSSYGGYATLLTHVIDDENLVRCGVSSAPVTSWIYYNTLYTERYMGTPTENQEGYAIGDLTRPDIFEKLRGKDFYIMHGNADDNVHYQNAAKLMKALQEHDIPFEQMSYPDEAHSLSGVARHRYNTMDRYWSRCLDLPDRDY